jgi:hypothetical protein
VLIGILVVLAISTAVLGPSIIEDIIPIQNWSDRIWR